MRLKVKRSARGSTPRRVLAALAAITALMAFAFAASAQATTYTPGTELITGKQTSSVAVDQSSGDVYVGSILGPTATSGNVYAGEEGGVQRFDSSGGAQSCALNPAPPHPDGLAVDPESGTLYTVNVMQSTAASEVLAYPPGCGPELPATTGTADMVEGSKVLTNVSTTHPLLVGQGIAGPGIPTAAGTANVTSGSAILTGVTPASGTFAVGQRVIGAGISALGGNRTIKACTPNCEAPTEIELSSSTFGYTGTVAITARTTVTKVEEGSEVELSNEAEETKSGAEIEGMSWQSNVYQTGFAAQQQAVDSSGNLLIPSYQLNKLEKFSPWGAEAVEGGFPFSTDRPDAVALDAAGNVYVTSSGTSTTFTCANTANGRLTKLNPSGEALPEGGPIGPESVFAGLSSDVTTVAVDQSTGNVYVGRGCQATAGHEFKVEEYGPGGTKLAEFGSGFGGGNIHVANHLALDEGTGTVYVADPGNFSVKVFEDTSAQKTLTTSVSGSEPGEVQCNMTGNACLSEYDEGQEVIVEATGENFEEWNGGTGSAEACNGSTETSCTFTLEANSSINAAYGAGTPEQPLTLKINEGEGTVVSNPAGITCTGSSGKECTEEFEEGAEVTLTASPAAGYRFQSWQSCAGGLNGRQCTVTMSEAKEVGVKFKRVYDLTIVKAGSGLGSVYNNKNGLTCTLRCSSVTIPFPEGVSFTLSGQAPNAEFYFKEFTGGTGSAAACSGTECTMTLSEASTVEAVFEDRPTANLSIDKQGGGTAKIWGLLWCSENCTSTSGDFFSGQPSATEVTVHWDLADGTDSIAWSGASGSDTCTGTFNRTEANEGKGSCKVTTNPNKSLTATLE